MKGHSNCYVQLAPIIQNYWIIQFTKHGKHSKRAVYIYILSVKSFKLCQHGNTDLTFLLITKMFYLNGPRLIYFFQCKQLSSSNVNIWTVFNGMLGICYTGLDKVCYLILHCVYITVCPKIFKQNFVRLSFLLNLVFWKRHIILFHKSVTVLISLMENTPLWQFTKLKIFLLV